MVNFNQLKALGTELVEKAGELAGQAKEKAGPLAAQAKEKAGPMAAQAKEKAGPMAAQAKVKAGPLVDKAKAGAAKGVDKAAGKIDDATGGKYSDKIGSVSDRLGTKAAAGPAASPFDNLATPTADPLTTPIVPTSTDPFAQTPIRDEIIEPYPPTLPPAPGSSI